MKHTVRACVGAAFVLLAGTSVFTQQVPRPSTGFPSNDTAYKSTYKPDLPTPGSDMRVEDTAAGRREWMKELMGGDLSPQFVEALLDAARAERERYPNAFATSGAGAWTNLGPVRSNWIQNGTTITESDTGRLRTILVHPSNADIVYVLTSGGGLWKTSNFLAPRPEWSVKTDSVLGVAGGAVAFGGSANTLYLGSGDPFDGGVGGFVTKSTNGGDSWLTSVKVGGATTVMDVKVDTTSGADVVFVATNAGLFRSIDAGASFSGFGNDAQNPRNTSHVDVRAVVFHPRDPDIAWVGSDGGVVRNDGDFTSIASRCGSLFGNAAQCQTMLSRVPARLYFLNKGLQTMQFYNVSVDPQAPLRRLIGGLQDNGTIWLDGSTNDRVWKPFFPSGDGTSASGFHPTRAAVGFASCS